MPVFLLAIFLQWSLSLLLISPHVLLDDFEYQPADYNCWISFKNLRGMFLAILTIYGGPLVITVAIYTWILRHARQMIFAHRKQRRASRRDVIILRRILVLLLFLVLIGVPTLFVLMVYIVTGYLTPLVYDIQALNISAGLVITPVILVCITPKIRSIFQRRAPSVSTSVTPKTPQPTTESSPSQLPTNN